MVEPSDESMKMVEYPVTSPASPLWPRGVHSTIPKDAPVGEDEDETTPSTQPEEHDDDSGDAERA